MEGRRVVAIVGDEINDAPVCLHTTAFESFRLIPLSQALTAGDVAMLALQWGLGPILLFLALNLSFYRRIFILC